MILGVDFSEGADLTQETMDCWKAQGVKKVVVQYSRKLPYYLSRLEGQGFDVDVYVYLYFPVSPWGQTPGDRVRACLDMIRGYTVGIVWLDVEEPTDSASPEDTVMALERCVGLVEQAGYGCGIYSGYYTYIWHTGNSTAFQRLPLWHANYIQEGPQADLSGMPTDFSSFRPYGGWTKPYMWQWHNTTMFCGHSVDLNVLEDGVKAQKEDPMIRFNSISTTMQNTGAGTYSLAQFDYPPPGSAKVVRLELYLDHNELGESGNLRVRDGNGDYAGQVGWDGARYGIVDIVCGDWSGFSLEGEGVLAQIGIVGYWE